MPQKYPRKRISVACHYCRHRKRRCDGEKPQCALCRESNIACEYPKQVMEEALPRREAVSQNQKILLRRLDRLESLLREESQQPAHTRNASENDDQSEEPNCEVRYDDAEDEASDVGIEDLNYAEHQNVSNDLDNGFHQMSETHQSLFLYPPNLNSLSAAITPDSTLWHATSPVSANLSSNTVEIEKNALENNSEIPEMNDQLLSISDGHLTIAGSLFLLEPIRRLIGEYPANFFYHIESIRTPPFENYNNSPKETLQNLNLKANTVNLLLSTFFTEVHIHFPILNSETFRISFYDVMKQGPCESLEMALCLTVLALRKLALSIQQDGSIHDNKSENGLEYFVPAHQILLASSWACFDLDTTIPTGLLSSIYLSYMSYPLTSWHLAYTASIKLQLMISQ
ncbi:uncharacterized protein N7483_009672 [Penicillium malachiteum]|uniref:uncharacterized protein n=1 Tax=Penicillium malachiteum TaxID=1324776 RepID=UPI0025484A12|nr:uncharacterized protein N7483_009672 [Penicillium malachiteum]KAJ5721738.1 hypothetical protein N7483_009672 [Penicillium malachiteum]